jgi:hypothetical protein
MKNKLLLFLFLSFCTAKCFSQAYHPLIEPNKYWQVYTIDATALCYADGGQEYFFNGDTIINGSTYNKLFFYQILAPQ